MQKNWLWTFERNHRTFQRKKNVDKTAQVKWTFERKCFTLAGLHILLHPHNGEEEVGFSSMIYF